MISSADTFFINPLHTHTLGQIRKRSNEGGKEIPEAQKLMEKHDI